MAKVLVIDDDEQIRDWLEILLMDEGHQVFLAQDGVEGVQCFHQFLPDLVITDINMPNKDGLEVIMELLKFNTKQPIIAMSCGFRNISAHSNLDLASALGAQGILEKPFENWQLQAIVAKFFLKNT